MTKMQLRFYLDDQRDADLVAWLAQQANRSLVVRQALRGWMSWEQGLDEVVLRRVLRGELAQVTVQAAAPLVPEASREDGEVAEALDGLLDTWADLDAGEE